MTPQDFDLDVDALMRKIRADVAERLGTQTYEAPYDPFRAQPPSSPSGDEEESATLERLSETAAMPKRKQKHALNELLAFHDEDFIRAAYLTLLGREPDVEGASRYLAALRSGSLAKVEVLGRIRFSPEGRAGSVRVAGLVIPFGLRTLRRVPLIGHAVGVIQCFLMLPTIVRNVERLEAVVFHHRFEIRRGVNALETEIENTFHGTQRRLNARANALDARLSRAEEAANRSVRDIEARVDLTQKAVTSKFDAWIQVLERDKADSSALQELRTRFEVLLQANHQLDNAQRDFRGITERIQTSIEALEQSKADALRTEASIGRGANEILELRERTAANENAVAVLRRSAMFAPGGDQNDVFDSFYLAFEDRFRGSREDIIGRVTVYLSYVLKAKAGTVSAPVLDVGCGRGEWLELLARSELVAQGIDLNRVVASHCRDRGLAVTEGDAIEYLRGLETGSIGAITAIHVIEHLPFSRIVALFDEAWRVLRVGGIAIFETPNPENLVVGACNFYYDPTHLRPLPPEPLRFVLAHRGFTSVEILPLHPRHDAPVQTAELTPLLGEITSRLFGAQDYAVIGYKE